MHVFSIATETAPFLNPTGLGSLVATALDALVKRGHEVHALVPAFGEMALGDYPLARRLKPLAGTCGGRELRFTHFEGRTPTGVQVHLLQPRDDGSRDELMGGFVAAATSLADSLVPSDGRGARIAWGRECAFAAKELLVLGTEATAFDAFANTLGDAAIAITPLAAARQAEAASAKLRSLFAAGRAAFIPSMVKAHPALTEMDKRSAKAETQAAFGLPVAGDVPLTLFAQMPPELLVAALSEYLRLDAQALVLRDAVEAPALEELAARYPDRLSLAPGETPVEGLLAGADLCACAGEPSFAPFAMSFGAVPVTPLWRAEGAVDAEPSLESGSAFLAASDDPGDFVAALGRGVTAFRLGGAFRAFARRIQSFPTTPAAFAEKLERLLAAVETKPSPTAPGEVISAP